MPAKRMSPQVIVGGAAATTALTHVVYEISTGRQTAGSLATIVGFYVAVFGILMAFAVWTARDLGLPSMLLLSDESPGRRWRRFLVWGIGMGSVLSLGCAVLSIEAAGSALRPWFLRNVETTWDAAILSARAALLEETLFRLFAIPFLISIAIRARGPRYSLRFHDGSAHAERASGLPSDLAVVVAVVVSSALFGMLHPLNPLPAFVFGGLLAMSYLRGGWESAVMAHFVANFLVFSMLYVWA